MEAKLFLDSAGPEAEIYMTPTSNILVAYTEHERQLGQNASKPVVRIEIADTDPDNTESYTVEFSKSLGHHDTNDTPVTQEFCFPIGTPTTIARSLGNQVAQKSILGIRSQGMGPRSNYDVGIPGPTPYAQHDDHERTEIQLHRTEFRKGTEPIMILGDIALFPLKEEA